MCFHSIKTTSQLTELSPYLDMLTLYIAFVYYINAFIRILLIDVPKSSWCKIVQKLVNYCTEFLLYSEVRGLEAV